MIEKLNSEKENMEKIYLEKISNIEKESEEIIKNCLRLF